MSIEIKLDSKAVRALIKDDDEFRLRLQNAVIAETLKGVMVRNPTQILKDAYPVAYKTLIASLKEEQVAQEMIEKVVREKSGSWKKSLRLEQGVREEIRQEAKISVRAEIESSINESMRQEMNDVVERLKTYYDERIGEAVNHLVNEELVKKAKEKVTEAFS